jgi:hypothetical protein
MIAFIFLIPVFEQIMMIFSCHDLKVVNTESSGSQKWVNEVERVSVGFYDSSINCAEGQAGIIFFVIIFFTLWGIAAPVYMLNKTYNELIIDYTSFVCKFILLICIKYIGKG